jgi:two-component system chemotaxis response regulator CheB
MPSAAIAHAKVDRVLTSDAIASALVALVREPIGEVVEMTHPSRPDVAEGAQDAIHQAKALGPPSPYSCPECGGTLWEFREGELLQYHCHLGHRFSGDNLVEAQSEALDVALWAALRALEEHSALHTRMAKHARERGSDLIAQKYEREARDAEDQADRIRRVLISDSPSSGAPERLSSSGSA